MLPESDFPPGLETSDVPFSVHQQNGNDHAEKDLEESQRGSGQDAPVCRCPLELDGIQTRNQELHTCSGDTLRDDTVHIDDSLVPHQHTRVFCKNAGQTRRVSRSVVRSAGAP